MCCFYHGQSVTAGTNSQIEHTLNGIRLHLRSVVYVLQNCETRGLNFFWFLEFHYRCQSGSFVLPFRAERENSRKRALGFQEAWTLNCSGHESGRVV